jgi:hypothetical protein
MAITDSQKVDYLFKKVGYGVTKTDTNANKLAPNESIASPLLLRGDKVWAEAAEIPSVKPSSDTSVVKLYTTVECSPDITATQNRTWKTSITDWIPPEFGSTYLVSIFIHDSNDPAGADIISNKVFVTGTNNEDEWFFDYQSGVLNFIGENLPNGKSFTGKSVYISGATYDGRFGVGDANVTQQISTDLTQEIANRQAADTNLQTQIDFITTNTDPAALDSLTEIVTAFQDADSAAQIASTADLATLEATLRSDLALPVATVFPAETFIADGTQTSFTLSNTPAGGEYIDVYINDVLQRPDIFSITNNVLTFTLTPDNGTDVYVKYRYADYATNQSIPNNSITNAHISFVYNSTQYTGDATTTDYSVPLGHTVHSVLVIVNGLILPPTDYSISGTTLTITNAPATNAVVDFRYLPI